jgi:hypothetical protein
MADRLFALACDDAEQTAAWVSLVEKHSTRDESYRETMVAASDGKKTTDEARSELLAKKRGTLL